MNAKKAAAPKAPKAPKKKREKKPRYGIAEWYGKDITKMSADERKKFGAIAVHQDTTGSLEGAPICPFMSVLAPGARCNKGGGVCSIRPYSEVLDPLTGESTKEGRPTPACNVVTVCPQRFLQLSSDGFAVLSTVAQKMIGTGAPTVIKETPFLKKLEGAAAITPAAPQPITEPTGEEPPPDNEADEDLAKMAGRIDWILADASDIESGGEKIEWCALEMQSVYFSGDAMGPEFSAYANGDGSLVFPVGKRRPDYRSSGPKRLAPQLNVKVPVMRAWGTKVAVVVDGFFFSNMSDLPEAHPKAKSEVAKRDGADVAWFIVDYNENMQLHLAKTIYAALDRSVDALNATSPVGKPEFNEGLVKLIRESLAPGSQKLGTKVFRMRKASSPTPPPAALTTDALPATP